MPKKRYIIIAAVAVVSLTAAFFMSGKPVQKNDVISENSAYSRSESTENESHTSSRIITESTEKSTSQESRMSYAESSFAEESSQKVSEEVTKISRVQKVSEVSDISEVQEVSTVPEISEVHEISKVHEISEVYEISKVQETSEQESSWQSENESSVQISEESQQHCTMLITCHTLVDNKENLKKNKRALVSDDGIILSGTEINITDGESVFDATKRICTERKIPFEFTLTPVYNTAYVEGIYNLYEFDCGSGSGWIYLVNGKIQSVGCSDCKLNDGDIVEWAYTCDLGHDIEASLRENE